MKTTFLGRIIDNKLAPVSFDKNHIINPIPITSLKPIRILEEKSLMLTCNVINRGKLKIKFSYIISIDGIPWAKNNSKENNQNEVGPPIGNLYEIIEGENKGCMLLCLDEIEDNDTIEIR